MEINILVIDDDKKICEQIHELLNGEDFNGNRLLIHYKNDFESGIKALEVNEYNILILDVYKGKPSEDNTDKPGQKIYDSIRKTCFIPIIFYSGLVKDLYLNQSEIVRVVRKGEGMEALKTEIQYILDSRLLFVKQKLNKYVNDSMRSYMWDFVHVNWGNLKEIKDEVSLSYLLIKRLSDSFDREDIIKLLGESKEKIENAHPMEFYIYPPEMNRYEMGDIFQTGNSFFIILTPSCDLVERKGKVKSEKILMAGTTLLRDTEEYNSYKDSTEDTSRNKSKGNIMGIIKNANPRFFFLPGTFFIPNLRVDFQNIISMPLDELKKFNKIAKLDNPFSQSMIAAYIRYYTRIGHEDIDSDHILKGIDKELGFKKES